MNKSLYNPLNKDFKVTYDINGDGSPVEYIVKGMEIINYDEPLS